MALGIAALFAPIMIGAAWMFAVGTRTCRSERFPPPGLKVLRDTPVHVGRPAIYRGRAIQCLSVALLLAAMVAGALLLKIAWSAQAGITPTAPQQGGERMHRTI